MTVSDRTREQLSDPQPRQLFMGRFGVLAFLSIAQTTVMGGNLLFFAGAFMLTLDSRHSCSRS